MKPIFFFATVLISNISYCQDIPIIKLHQLVNLIEYPKAKVTIINFWATWCAPCVKELPLFERINNNKEVEVILVNLDFAEKIDKVHAFVTKQNIKSKVLLLDEIDYNSWIDKVDETWEGTIPATLIINGLTGKRKFVATELSNGDIEKLILLTK